MKRLYTTLFAAILLMTSCGPKADKHYLEALCKYIPDHGMRVEAKKYLTEDYFNAYAEAFAAPVGDYGYIGDNDWLYYFVSGNGGGQPVFDVKDFKRDGGRIEADVEILGDPDPHKAIFLREGGQWKVADWDGTKSQCLEYIQTMRQKYADGTIERQMLQDSTLAPHLDDFKKELEEFYNIFGR